MVGVDKFMDWVLAFAGAVVVLAAAGLLVGMVVKFLAMLFGE